MEFQVRESRAIGFCVFFGFFGSFGFLVFVGSFGVFLVF